MPLSGGKLSWNPIDPIKTKTSIGSQLGGLDLESFEWRLNRLLLFAYCSKISPFRHM